MMKTKVGSEKQNSECLRQITIVWPCLARAHLPRSTMYLTHFVDFSVIPLSPVMLKVFSEVLDTYPLYNRLLDTHCVLGTVLVPEATKMTKT